VLIPVYNVEQYLSECIDSVLAQTYPAHEIILVDDGSKDKSGQICDKYATEYPFIKTFHKQNGGQLSARQHAIENATGDFYIFLDSDDSIKPETLQTIYSTIIKYNCDCVIYDFERYQNGVSIECAFDLSLPDRVIVDKRELFRTVFLDQRFNSMCRKAVKSSVFTGIDYERFYHVSLGEDLLQSLEVLENCKKAVIIPHPLYNYRLNNASVTHTINYTNYRIDYTVEEQMLSLIKRSNVFTNADINELRDYRIVCLVDTIRNIALFDATFQQKKALYNEICNSNYYQNFLSEGISDPARVGLKRYYFMLFNRKKYRLIILCEKIYTFLRDLRKH
jgi:glycosyltransferase involved in cell wall biosynthesis